MSDIEMNHDDDDVDFGFEDIFDEEPPAEEAVTTAAAVAAEPAEPEPAEPAEPGPSVGVTRPGKAKPRRKQRKQAASIAGSEDLDVDAEQVEPDLVESDADAVADANERVGLDRHSPARFVAGGRHANLTATPLLRPTGVTGTGPINAGVAGAVSIEEYKALQIKLQSALAEKNHLSQQCRHSDELIHKLQQIMDQLIAVAALLGMVILLCQCRLQLNLLDLVRPAAAVGTGTAAPGATVAPSVPLPHAPAPVLAPVKALEPRKPKPFSGEGVAAQHGHVRRFLRVLTQYFELSKLPTDLWAPHARMYLEDSAAEHMDTAVQVLPITERDNWDKFCEILTSGFGTLDPDAEAWAKLRLLQQRKLSASEYVHQMRACFNGITVLPLSAGEKIERFLKFEP
ncbi:TPA: hypothetical protein ACH3X1_010371 [Trebouxia sp. C0004]